MEGEGPERSKWAPLFRGWPPRRMLVLRTPPPPLPLRPPLAPPVLLPPPPAEVGVGISTGFLERLRPRCTWRSQYLWPDTTSLEHLHFLPSVLRHRPGSGSIETLPQYPDCITDSTRQNTSQLTHMTNKIFTHNCCIK